MHDHPKGAEEDRTITTWDEDDREQVAVLRLALEHHPATLDPGRAGQEMNG